MGIVNNALAGASGQSTAYNLQRSLRFRSSASAYLNRTPASASNRQTWTWSMWVKRGSLGVAQNIFAANGTTDTTFLDIRFTSSDTIQVGVYTDIVLVTTQVFRDPSAWYHIVWTFDTTQATAANRCRLYVNGSQITSFSTDARATYFAQNTNYGINNNTAHNISRNPSDNAKFLDGYLTEVNFIDGQALTPSSFGMNDPQTGVWEPKRYTGTYGTNGFYLPFVPASASFSGSFNGTNQFLSVAQNAAFSFGTGDFTVEAFVNANSWNSVNPIIALGDGAVGGGSPVYSGWCMRYDSSGALGLYRFDGTETYLTGSVTLPTGQWNHLAISRASGTLRIFANGVQVYSAANSISYNNVNSDSLKIGGNWRIGGGVVTWVNGAISNVRIVKGTGLYTASFTPPTAALTAVSGTSLLTLQNSSIVDNSPNAFSITNNNSVTTSSANPFTSSVGLDASGNGNNWTANNISLTDGTTYDSMTDVPTLTSATQANYCVLNPLDTQPVISITNANLTSTYAGGAYTASCRGTISVSSGKWYWETTLSTVGTGAVGITGIDYTLAQTADNRAYNSATTYAFYNSSSTPFKLNGGTQTSYGTSVSNGDVIGVAVDLDGGSITFYRNGTTMGVAYTGISGTFAPLDMVYSGAVHNTNFGQRPFAYTPPTGFVALNTFNLPTPTIGATASTQANKYFDATTYTGNGGTLNVNNSGSFSPDLVWIKSRSISADHGLHDRLRGEPYSRLSSNNTDAETTGGSFISSFGGLTSTGFQLNNNSAGNQNAATYVGWQWRANGSGVTNTAGSITSTVSANTSSGFSIVTYTGTGANATVGHGLGVAPRMVIYKRRNSADSWIVYHASIGAANSLTLNNTNAQAAGGSFYWNSTAPTSSVFSTGTDSAVNANGSTYVAYCFSQIAGYSAFGSYTGNGSTDGTFVYTGFRPRFIMHKRTDVGNPSADWRIWDTARNTFNVADSLLFPNQSIAESTNAAHNIDILSNGFKFRTSDSNVNGNGAPYIFMAFAENPFKYSLAR